MRFTLVLVSTSLLGACSFIDRIELSGSRQGATTDKVYLGKSRVTASARELERYACEQGPMICDLRGTSYECRCPN